MCQATLKSIGDIVNEFNENCKMELHTDETFVWDLLEEVYMLATGKELDTRWWHEQAQ